MNKPVPPSSFEQRVARQLGPETAAFTEAMKQPPTLAVRRNRRKPATLRFDEDVPWCPQAVYVQERPSFILDPLWHAGAYYVQEPASLLLDHALRTFGQSPEPRRVLDLCAAPGGKTTLLADFLGDDALLVANEVIRTRETVLRENVTRWGWPNILTSNHDPEDFAPLSAFFDLVVVDAPCSGEGLFRKEPEAVREWSERNAELCAARQQRILDAAQPLVRPDGLLIYSTCTFNPAENDEVIRRACRDGWQYLPLPCPPEWGVVPTEFGLQCWPHRCRGEGFYLAVLRRDGRYGPMVERKRLPASAGGTMVTDDIRKLLGNPDPFPFHFHLDPSEKRFYAVPAAIAADTEIVRRALRRTALGLPLAEIKGKDVVPSHALALSVTVAPDLPTLVVDRETALEYLRKNPLTVAGDTPAGWLRVVYEGWGLGWVKNLPGRTNNYLPSEWRIRRL
ncbi:MAG: hypothetical protein SFU56_13785 [Capsulimonadales bacterium]|nr:hypothetical protein [Capsulimonadales bacterium]